VPLNRAREKNFYCFTYPSPPYAPILCKKKSQNDQLQQNDMDLRVKYIVADATMLHASKAELLQK
jgi:hypothetical protein